MTRIMTNLLDCPQLSLGSDCELAAPAYRTQFHNALGDSFGRVN